MEALEIALVAVSATLLITVLLWWRAGRGRRRARRDATELRQQLGQATAHVATLRRGEREAAWTAATSTDRLQRSLVDLDKAEHEVRRLAGDVDSLQDQVTEVDGELRLLKEQHAAAVGQIGTLETDLVAALLRATESEQAAELVGGLESRLETVTKERDRLSATVHHAEQLETELSALGRVRQERDDLARRLAAITEARLAEQAEARERQAELERLRASDAVVIELDDSADAVQPDPDAPYAERDRILRQRVAAAVEAATARLEREIAHLRLVLAEKERIIRVRLAAEPAQIGTAAPAAAITDIKGIGSKIAAILAGHGITSVADVAALDDDDIDDLAAEMPVYPGRIRNDDWVGQARRLLG